jgi:hypothetical protein
MLTQEFIFIEIFFQIGEALYLPYCNESLNEL